MRRAFLIIGPIALLLVTAVPALAVVVQVPLRIDYFTLDELLKQQMYTGPDGRAELWEGSNACQYLHARNPHFGRAGEAVKIESEAELNLGFAIGDKCLSPAQWSGIIEAEARPYITPGLALKFRVTDINLYNMKHEKTFLVGRGFDLVKSYFIPRFERFSFDLKPPLNRFEELVRDAAPPDVAERVQAALSTLQPVRSIVAEDEALRLTLQLTAPEGGAPIVSGPAAPLTPAQVEAWQATLDNWDAFIVFAVKQLGLTVGDPQVREQLLALLLESRHRLVEALAQPRDPGTGPDPVRLLFLDVWKEAGEIVRSAAHRGLLRDRSLEFLSFISAGDALFALDEAAPALGMRVSAEDLRRLARIMAPGFRGNPLVYDFNEDPELQRLFGLSELPETPDLVVPPDDTGALREEELEPAAGEVPGVSPSASPTPTSAATPAPASRTPSMPESRSSLDPTAGSAANCAPEPVTLSSPLKISPLASVAPVIPPGTGGSSVSMLVPHLGLFDASEVLAAETVPVSELLSLGSKLRLAVVDETNLESYRRTLGDLLTLIAERELGNDPLEAQYHQTYLILLRATAWQESCWQQYVRRKGHVAYLMSPTGDIGLMQINKYVWRGFFNLARLKWDILYNSAAGAQILTTLMRGVLRRGADYGGGADALARSTYAAYNGGPRAYRRWRREDESEQARQVDQAFWEKYRALQEDKPVAILECAASRTRARRK